MCICTCVCAHVFAHMCAGLGSITIVIDCNRLQLERNRLIVIIIVSCNHVIGLDYIRLQTFFMIIFVLSPAI